MSIIHYTNILQHTSNQTVKQSKSQAMNQSSNHTVRMRRSRRGRERFLEQHIPRLESLGQRSHNGRCISSLNSKTETLLKECQGPQIPSLSSDTTT